MYYLINEIDLENGVSFSSISDVPKSKTGYSNEIFSECVPLTFDNFDLDDFNEAIDSNLEGNNHHSLIGLSTIFTNSIINSTDYITAKNVMWYMLNTYGLDWNNFSERS